MFKNLISIPFILLLAFSSPAQQTAGFTDELSLYNKALELYDNQQYLAAQNLFSRLEKSAEDLTIKGDCSYYVANCAIRLNQKDADQLVEDFMQKYPTSIKRNSAYMEVAHYYFNNEKFASARKWYGKVDEAGLSRKEREKFEFNNGYALFRSNSMTKAKKYFQQVENSETYGVEAKYYLGFIAYSEDDYETATAYFDQVKDDPRYAGGMSYYQADMNFKLGNFQEAIDMGLAQYEAAEPAQKSQLAKIIGESYFNLGKYAESIPYLKNYKGIRGRWNNTDFYLLGYAYYQQKDYENAVAEFTKIAEGRNAVAQNAFYHLAESYLRLDQKPQALNAFKNASEMDFSPEIKQDAWLNYAKLSYEIGNNYQSVPEVLQSFVDAYPDNPNNEELKDLLIDSYITAKNYEGALNLLENNPSFDNKLAYQKVAFLRGIELYGENDYAGAIVMFDKSLGQPRVARITARATYWKAECDYLLSNFNASLVGYKQFMQLPEANTTPEYENAKYNLAYNQFKLKNYPEAIRHFQSFVSSTSANGARKTDAYLRLGDSHFVSSSYWPAMESYGQAIELGTPDEDYAAFQTAISYGFVDRVNQKVEGLRSFGNRYPKSIYRDDALYELGNTYVALDQTNDAIRAYDQLLNELPGSKFVAQTLLKKALIYDNTRDSEQALRLFKRVANDFPNSNESLQAVASAKLIYIDQGRVDEYAEWVNRLDFVEVEDAELDDATYKAAERPYLENNTQEARKRFEDYVSRFPNGRHGLKANFYLAQMYFGENNVNQAIPAYEYVVNQPTSEYTEEALARLSEMYLGQENYAKAIGYLQRLEQEADFPQNVIFAQTNSMKAYYELGQYPEAVAYADKVLQNSKIENNIKSDAQVIIARSAMKSGDEAKAQQAYGQVLRIASGKLAAEALYYDAYFKHKDGQFEPSNASIQKLAKDYSGYKYYGAKGLVLMAKNFYQLDDAYQASYILESVIQNFADFPEIVAEAQEQLRIVKATQAKTNSSVSTDGN